MQKQNLYMFFFFLAKYHLKYNKIHREMLQQIFQQMGRYIIIINIKKKNKTDIHK